MKMERYTGRIMASLRKYVGKQLVSFLRQNDFAHAGEADAIDLVMSYFKKDPSQTILDVGCGLGGTAEYIQNKGWGKVSGFDIEFEATAYAKQTYPAITFYTCDVVKSEQLINKQFDILTLFNVFYAFNDQLSALRSLNKLTKVNGTLVIFDYADPCINQTTPLFRAGSKTVTPFIPVKLNEINTLLERSGWEKTKMIDVSNRYLEWYDQLIKRLHDNEENVVSKFNLRAFENALETYTKIRNGISENILGGTVIYAKKFKT